MNDNVIALTEKRFFEWHIDDKSVCLRSKSGSYGGGSEVLVITESAPTTIKSERYAKTITRG